MERIPPSQRIQHQVDALLRDGIPRKVHRDERDGIRRPLPPSPGDKSALGVNERLLEDRKQLCSIADSDGSHYSWSVGVSPRAGRRKVS